MLTVVKCNSIVIGTYWICVFDKGRTMYLIGKHLTEVISAIENRKSNHLLFSSQYVQAISFDTDAMCAILRASFLFKFASAPWSNRFYSGRFFYLPVFLFLSTAAKISYTHTKTHLKTNSSESSLIPCTANGQKHIWKSHSADIVSIARKPQMKTSLHQFLVVVVARAVEFHVICWKT